MLAMLTTGCSSGDQQQAVAAGELRPSEGTPTLCYIAQHSDIREGIMLQYDSDNGALVGKGEGWLYSSDRAYSIEITAHCPDAQKGCPIKIRRQMLDDGSIYHNQENWHLQAKLQQWRSQPLSQWLPNTATPALRYYRIHCYDAPTKDQTLWDNVHIFSDGYAPAQRGDKYALVDTNLQMRLPAQYTELGFIHEGSMFFVENIGGIPMRGIIDTAGNVLLPAQYTAATPFYEGVAWAVHHRGKGWQLFNRAGKALTDDQFTGIHFSENQPSLCPCTEKLCAAERNGKWGFINTEGKTAIPFQYDFARNFAGGKAEVVLGDKTIYIDYTGKQLPQ